MEIRPMTEKDAHAIQAWTYEPPYDFYNQVASAEGINELMTYCAVHNQGLYGFFCLGTYAQVPNATYDYSGTYVDVGLGMHPALTGQGRGRAFVETVIREAEREGRPLRLTVAVFNQRAVRLYGQLGFQQVASFEKGATRFIVMVK
ncbi:acetyltransferase family protein [Exiguobacterium sp. S17]|nr:acetyltransferase family protein [Exiguobacterium sp. S17]